MDLLLAKPLPGGLPLTVNASCVIKESQTFGDNDDNSEDDVSVSGRPVTIEAKECNDAANGLRPGNTICVPA